MTRRLVILSGTTTDGRGRPWAVVAAENGCDGVEVAGSGWCLANRVDGLGVCTELGPQTPPEWVTNQATLTDRLRTARTTNVAFLALASPTNVQTLAQVRLLTRECNALIRLTLQTLDDVSDT